MSDIKRKRERTSDDSAEGLVFSCLKGVLWGFALLCVLWFVLSAVAYASDDPDSSIGIFAAVALFAGAFAAGFASSKYYPFGWLQSGLLGGAFYVIILWLISLFLRSDSSRAAEPLYTLIGYLIALAVAVFGSFVGRRRQKMPGAGKKSPVAMARKKAMAGR